jgi:dihydrofolate reductase
VLWAFAGASGSTRKTGHPDGIEYCLKLRALVALAKEIPGAELLTLQRAAAGDKDVSVAGGANIVQQYLSAGLLDEIQIHLVPVLLGEGRRLVDRIATSHIELERMRVIESPGVTHLKFRVVKEN